MEGRGFIHKEYHETLNCEKCGANYCIDIDRKEDGGDEEPCIYWCQLPGKTKAEGLCEFCDTTNGK